MTELISINEAAARGIERLRKPTWANPCDHLKIDVLRDGDADKPGPWTHLYTPFNKECNGRDPVDILCVTQGMDYTEHCWVPYTGPLPDSEEYKAAVAAFARKAAV